MKNLLRNVAYASVIIASLSFAIHEWNSQALAQAPPGRTIVGFIKYGESDIGVILDNGDVYRHSSGGWPAPPIFLGNFWGEAGEPVVPTTWSGVKTKEFRKP